MIKRVKLENWRSHKNTEFEFEEGTNVLVGAMGSGKSSVMNAICFALFGTFPELQRREARLDGVIMGKPSQEDSAGVEMEFDYKGKNYRVERAIHRGKKTNTARLYEAGTFLAGPKASDVNERVERLLELNYELFSRAVYSEQNQMDFFIRLNASERKQKFDELLGLDVYERVRKNAVSIGNVLKRLAVEKKRDLEEQKAGLGEEELKEIKKSMAGLKAKIQERKREKEKAGEKAKALERAAEALRAKKEKFNRLEEKRIALAQSIKSLEGEISEIEGKAGTRLESLDAGKLAEMESGLGSREKKLKALEKELNSARIESKGLNARIESMREENQGISSSLPEKISGRESLLREMRATDSKKEKLESEGRELGERLKALAESEKNLGEKIKVNESRAAGERSVLERIKAEKADCPLCKRPLTKKARQGILSKAESELKRLEEEKKSAESGLEKVCSGKQELEKKNAETERDLTALGELKAFLKSLKKPLERLEENREKEEKLGAELKRLGKREKELMEKNIESGLKGVEEQFRNILRLRDGLKKAALLREKRAEGSRAVSQIKELGFDEAKALEIERGLAEKRESLRSFDKEINGLAELLGEKEKRELEFRKKRELVEKAVERVFSLEYGVSELGIFTSALKATQAELRESLVETINHAMDTVWKRLYPYRDYVSAKMEISEGNYELMVKGRAGQWTMIEGTLSGGERSAVALTLRIAFSLVLARNLGILILDEPTHNLDEAAVSKLSGMMREHLPGLVEQVFLITHNKEMEKAANASLYLLERDKEMDGITRAELLSLRD